jgi:16S rRNA (guanine527-N7)-methyltransferase
LLHGKACQVTTLDETLSQHGIEVPGEFLPRLEQYCTLLWEWNQKLNLTRHTDYEKFVTRDLVDTQQLSSLLHPGERVLDVGSGGGVPGILLAILRPDLSVSLCESIGKKATVLQSLVATLRLSSPVLHARAEDILQESRFDVLTARAVGPLWKMLKWFRPHWSAMGRFLVIKGPGWIEERGEARHRGLLQGLELRCALEYRTPGSNAQNVVLQLWPKGRDEH